jgi:hypothetical protein
MSMKNSNDTIGNQTRDLPETGRIAPSKYQNNNLYRSEQIVSASILEHCTFELIKLRLEKNGDFALNQSVCLVFIRTVMLIRPAPTTSLPNPFPKYSLI